jgi:hypothetical protein
LSGHGRDILTVQSHDAGWGTVVTVPLRVATQKVEENKPYTLLHREYHPIAIRLTESGEVGTLPDLEFLMPKSAVEAADHVGMGVTGSNNLYWPIPVELK